MDVDAPMASRHRRCALGHHIIGGHLRALLLALFDERLSAFGAATAAVMSVVLRAYSDEHEVRSCNQ